MYLNCYRLHFIIIYAMELTYTDLIMVELDFSTWSITHKYETGMRFLNKINKHNKN